MFSDSGTFILISFQMGIMPSMPQVIHQLDADPVTTRYFPLTDLYYLHKYLTPSGEFTIETEEVDRNSTRLASRKVAKNNLLEESSDFTGQDQDETPIYLDNVICCPSSLADGDRFLLLGKNDDEKMRLLIVPRQGRSLEIRSLSLTFNEAKSRLEAEWKKRQALKDKEMEETGKQNE